MSELFITHWKQVRKDLFWALNQFQDQDLFFTPYKGGWSVGEIALHIGNAEQGWIEYVVQQKGDDWPKLNVLKTSSTIEGVKNYLAGVHKQTLKTISQYSEKDLKREIKAPWGSDFSLGWIIWHVLEHEIHHRGELSLILGMLGREGPVI